MQHGATPWYDEARSLPPRGLGATPTIQLPLSPSIAASERGGTLSLFVLESRQDAPAGVDLEKDDDNIRIAINIVLKCAAQSIG